MDLTLGLRASLVAMTLAAAGPVSATVDSPSGIPQPHSVEPGRPTRLASQVAARLEQAFDQSRELLQAGQYKEADAVLTKALADPEFDEAPLRQKTGLWLYAGLTARIVGDSDRALASLKLANGSPFAVADGFLQEFEVATWQGQHAEAAAAAVTLLRRWPERKGDLDSRAVHWLAHELAMDPALRADQVAFLDAMFDAGWALQDGREASSLWLDLVLAKIEARDLARATAVAAHVRAPRDVVAMKIDRRFDEVLARLPADLLDVNRAAAEQVAALEAAVAREPRRLEHRMALTYALLETGRYEQVLSLCDDALKRASGTGDPPPYDDADEYLVWIRDNRARALLHLHRTDEAVAAWEEARRLPENGGENVSQAINLAMVYGELGRTDLALQSLAAVNEENTSPFGWMQYHAARLGALERTPDAPLAVESLAYLREHRRDSESTYTEALASVGRLDDAAQSFIRRLDDPAERNRALLDAQIYPNDAYSPVLEQRFARWREVLGRDDVKAAVGKYGRQIEVPLHRTGW